MPRTKSPAKSLVHVPVPSAGSRFVFDFSPARGEVTQPDPRYSQQEKLHFVDREILKNSEQQDRITHFPTIPRVRIKASIYYINNISPDSKTFSAKLYIGATDSIQTCLDIIQHGIYKRQE